MTASVAGPGTRWVRGTAWPAPPRPACARLIFSLAPSRERWGHRGRSKIRRAAPPIRAPPATADTSKLSHRSGLPVAGGRDRVERTFGFWRGHGVPLASDLGTSAKIRRAKRATPGRASDPRTRLAAARTKKKPGDYLLSRSLAESLPLALRGLTTEFGMGSGVAPSVWSPGNGNSQLHCLAKKNKVAKPHGRLVPVS